MNLFWEIVGSLTDDYLSSSEKALAAIMILLAVAFFSPLLSGIPTVSDAKSRVDKNRRALGALLFTSGFAFVAVVAYGRWTGYLRSTRMDGYIRAREGHDVTDARLAVFTQNAEESDAAVAVHSSGSFSIENCYRRVHQLFAFKINDTDDVCHFSRHEWDLDESSHVSPFDFPLESRRVKRLAVVNFARGRHTLDDHAIDQVNKLLSEAPDDVELLLWLGFADENGAEPFNGALGMRRAKEVRARSRIGHPLVTRSKHLVLSFGETWPALSGTGEIVWAQNRRPLL